MAGHPAPLGARLSTARGSVVRGAPPGRLGVTLSGRGAARRLTAEQRVAAAPDACCAFFSDPRNLESLTPPFLRFRILTPMPVVMGEGTRIEYRLRLLGLPLRWVSRIEDWRPGRGFTDVQTRGPYARWTHRHEFVPVPGGTRVRDEVDYALPLAPLTDPVHALFVGPRLREIFAYRQAAIARVLG